VEKTSSIIAVIMQKADDGGTRLSFTRGEAGGGRIPIKRRNYRDGNECIVSQKKREADVHLCAFGKTDPGTI